MTRPACTIDSAWCDLAGVYLNGWAHLHETPVLSMRLSSGDSSVDLQRLLRPDVLAEFPDVPAGAACGFEAYLPCPPFRPVTLHLRTHYGAVDLDIKAGAEQTPQAGPEFQRAAPIGLLYPARNRTPLPFQPTLARCPFVPDHLNYPRKGSNSCRNSTGCCRRTNWKEISRRSTS